MPGSSCVARIIGCTGTEGRSGMRRTYNGSCHCGKVQFEVTADIDHVRVCDCSICRKRGALIFRVDEADLRLKIPLEELSLYQWGSRTAKDYFCPTCGILPFRRPSHPTASEISEGVKTFAGWAINVRCLDDIAIFSLPQKRIHGSKL
jgi:hypothetical protein